jgi:hypothetical protein
MNSVKETLLAGFRMFGIEFMMTQNQEKITKYVRAYLNGMTPKDVIGFMSSGTLFPVTDDIIKLLQGYKEVVKLYSPLNFAQMFLEQLSIARPDLFATIMAFPGEGSSWVLISLTSVYDRVLEIKPAVKKVILKCNHCQEELSVEESKVVSIKKCPFCEALFVEPIKEEIVITPPPDSPPDSPPPDLPPEEKP